jgi:hypothetical protein
VPQSFLHRFGAALNPHFHFHLIVLDGLFAEQPDGSVAFHEATHFSTDDMHRLERTLQRRVLRLFLRRGLLDDHTVADMLTWRAAGGFSLDASVRIDRSPDGRERLVLSPLDFLAALARLIPPPRVHRHRYHGVLAPNARMRARVVAMANASGVEPQPSTTALSPDSDHAPDAGPHAHPAARSRWARLLARIYEVFPLRCPECGHTMRILALLNDPTPIHAILQHLDLPTSPPPIAPARAPPQHDLEFDAEHTLVLDQTPAFDPADPEPVPDFQFDQSADR